jgi:hypothetical protein
VGHILFFCFSLLHSNGFVLAFIYIANDCSKTKSFYSRLFCSIIILKGHERPEFVPGGFPATAIT